MFNLKMFCTTVPFSSSPSLMAVVTMCHITATYRHINSPLDLSLSPSCYKIHFFFYNTLNLHIEHFWKCLTLPSNPRLHPPTPKQSVLCTPTIHLPPTCVDIVNLALCDLQEMPSPFQTLAASTRRDYVTVVWRKAQQGTATSEWTRLPFRPY